MCILLPSLLFLLFLSPTHKETDTQVHRHTCTHIWSHEQKNNLAQTHSACLEAHTYTYARTHTHTHSSTCSWNNFEAYVLGAHNNTYFSQEKKGFKMTYVWAMPWAKAETNTKKRIAESVAPASRLISSILNNRPSGNPAKHLVCEKEWELELWRCCNESSMPNEAMCVHYEHDDVARPKQFSVCMHLMRPKWMSFDWFFGVFFWFVHCILWPMLSCSGCMRCMQYVL